MDADTPEIVEAVAIALFRNDPVYRTQQWQGLSGRAKAMFRSDAEKAIAAARPFILEEAAKVCEDLPSPWDDPVKYHANCIEAGGWSNGCDACAQAIRSLSKDGEGLDDHQG